MISTRSTAEAKRLILMSFKSCFFQRFFFRELHSSIENSDILGDFLLEKFSLLWHTAIFIDEASDYINIQLNSDFSNSEWFSVFCLKSEVSTVACQPVLCQLLLCTFFKFSPESLRTSFALLPEVNLNRGLLSLCAVSQLIGMSWGLDGILDSLICF